MFNSFLDGTKSAIEMAAIANACDLDVPEDGLSFPPCGVDDLAHVLRPRAVGGQLEQDGMVEVVSSLERDGRPVFRDLRWGVYVVLKAPNDYAAACFKQYGLPTDSTGRYAAMYKPFHLIGLELSISVLNAGAADVEAAEDISAEHAADVSEVMQDIQPQDAGQSSDQVGLHKRGPRRNSAQRWIGRIAHVAPRYLRALHHCTALIKNSTAKIIPLSSYIDLLPANEPEIETIINDTRKLNLKIVIPMYNARRVLYPNRSQQYLLPDIEYLMVSPEVSQAPETIREFTDSLYGEKLKDEKLLGPAIITIEKYLMSLYTQKKAQRMRKGRMKK
jgi:hypothetical protein